MRSLVYSEYYPVSIEDIRERYSNRRRKKKSNQLCLDFSQEYIIRNEYGEEIKKIEGDIPNDLSISTGEVFLFISFDQSKYTHGIHKYPAKFFPELPRWLIRKYSREGELILDPFAGSATANIEALLNRRNSICIDIDPFARFLAKVKITPLNTTELKNSKKELLNIISNFSFDKITEDDIPDFPYKDNWFNREIILELSYIKKSILSLNYDQDIKDFYLILFSSIIRSVSNADDNCTRTVIRKKLNKVINPADALKKFVYQIFLNVPKMIEFSEKVDNKFFVEIPVESDARNIQYPDETFDLAITSPPYVNAVDYPRTHQLEIYWLDFAKNTLLPLKRCQIGTESVFKEKYNEQHLIGVEKADVILRKIYEVDKRRAYIAYNYLHDMELNLREVYRTIKKGSRYIVVVGNNRIRNNTFESWRYLIEIAERTGFSLETYFGSEIIKHFIKVPRQERINTDWIIVLKK